MSSTMIRSARRSSFTASAVRSTPGQVLEQEAEARRRGRRVGDHDVHPVGLQQVREPRLAAEAVAVGIDVGGEADPLSRWNAAANWCAAARLSGGRE